MKNLIFALFSALILFSNLSSQETIDNSLSFQSVEKSYSLYIPSSYDPAQPQAMMLGLHPFNPNRWNGRAWRDTLINFAETNDLLLVCPDGGPDGRVDDDIDTSFMTTLLDSVNLWYNINPDERYAMGFSWGGRTTLTYGLRHQSEYRGLLVIGAAIDINILQNVVGNAKDQNIYIVHGSNDTPNVRFTPILNALEDNEACVETNLLQGIGHTIDFPDRNQILSDGFNWLKANNCVLNSTQDNEFNPISIFPNPSFGTFTISEFVDIKNISIKDINGQEVSFEKRGQTISLNTTQKGMFIIQVNAGKQKVVSKLMLH